MADRIAIVDGIRTPFAKAGSALKKVHPAELGRIAVSEVLSRTELDGNLVDELIFGNVAQPADSANIARVIALRAKLPIKTPAMTVHRNCASGMEAITTAASRILTGEGEVYVAGGTESMSQIPLLYNQSAVDFFERMFRAKTMGQRLQNLLTLRLKMFSPIIGVEQGLTDPICGLNMGGTAEKISKYFGISRLEQDEYALQSHLKALAAQEKGIFKEEIVPVPLPPKFDKFQTEDVGPRKGQTLEALQKLKPFFDRKNGTVTVGNACPITDGAAALILMPESKAKAMGYEPLGYLKSWAYAGLPPEVMGLGPAYATPKALKKVGMSIKDIQLIEINEAFAAQVIGCERALDSEEFCKKNLGLPGKFGSFDRAITNVNGGAIALGHPVGTSGARLVLTLLKEMKRRGLGTGLATLCIGGGQGAALVLER